MVSDCVNSEKNCLQGLSGENDVYCAFPFSDRTEQITELSGECIDTKIPRHGINPCFGGGYPQAYECGCDHMNLIVNNLSGKVNSKNTGDYSNDIFMMKYNEIEIEEK